jgi:hypothetical protein
MKRIAALAALVVTMLAVPAAALADTGASTGGSGPGYGRPGPIQVACHPGYVKEQRLRALTQVYLRRHRHGKPVIVRVVCPYIPAKPRPAACGPQQLVFNMAAGSSTVTEVSGPVLSPRQEFSYGGGTYTITSVNPGAGRFTVFKDGWLFVNQGTAITDGVGWLGCSA